MLWEKLNNFGLQFYSSENSKFAQQMFNLANELKLDERAKIISYLLRSDLANENVKSAIKADFSADVLKQLELLGRISNFSFSSKSKDAVNKRKAFIELTDDISIIIIKLIERLVSLRTADLNSSENLVSLSDECLYFYAPIAQMLGIRKIYNEMEDISFKNLFPKDFEFLTGKLKDKESLHNAKISEMRNELLKALAENKIEARLQSRIKRPYSIFRKIRNKKIPLEEVYDLLALRVITKNAEDCYLTLGVVHRKWVPIEGRFRDWISYPKPNGYRSIQTTVHTRKGDKFEIQIRTEEMHEEAEFGSSAHWAYKSGGSTSKISWIQSLREFLDNDEYIDNPYEFFENLKNEMKRSYINVLTPKGDIVSLPEGASPLDFAFSIHTNLGYKTTGAKVNSKFVKLKTELKSGDVVDIISNPSSTPSRDWLSYVKTSRARSKILRWFKKNERELYIIQGKNAWERLIDQHKRKLRNFEDEQKLKNNINKIGYKSFDDFYFGIANGSVKCSLFLLKKLYPDAFKNLEKERKVKQGIRSEQTPPVIVEGLNHLDTMFARCCNPIKGQPIVAYITKKSQIKIHSAECQIINQENIDTENIKTAEWLVAESTQQVRCKCFGDSYSKLLSYAVNSAEAEKISIINANKIEGKGKREGLFVEVLIKDILQFDKFISRIKSAGGVDVQKIA